MDYGLRVSEQASSPAPIRSCQSSPASIPHERRQTLRRLQQRVPPRRRRHQDGPLRTPTSDASRGSAERLKCSSGFADCDLIRRQRLRDTRSSTTTTAARAGTSARTDSGAGLNTQGISDVHVPGPARRSAARASEQTCFGSCFDLTSDSNNCGACGVRCLSSVSQGHRGLRVR